MENFLSNLSQPIAIHPDYYKMYKTTILSALRNGKFESIALELQESKIKTKIWSLNNDAKSIEIAEEYELSNPSIPENSIAVIILEGMIYPWKAYQIENYVKAANENKNVNGILFFVNTPGGYIHRVDITSEAIKKSKKPTAAYVTGMCASAGMFMFSGAGRIFCASEMDVLGSIGTMTTFVDDKKFWEQLGIVLTDIYASDSTLKNFEFREAQNGNFEPLIKNLDFYNEIFHKTIAENLNIILDKENPIFKGAVFFSNDAIKAGLAHEIMDFDGALDWVMKEGMKFKANNNNF